MPENTTPEPVPQPPAPSPKRPRNLINKDWIDEVIKTEALVAVAEKDEYFPILADGGITSDFLDELKGLLQTADDIISQAEQKTTSARGATQAEKAAKARLMAAIRVVQARAKQTYAATNALALKDYFVGIAIAGKRTILESAAQSIVNKLAGDTLKGLKTDQVDELKNALKAYKESQTDQRSQQADASIERTSLQALVNKIAARRREILFAVDAQWPASNAAIRPIRREFGLPATKPLGK